MVGNNVTVGVGKKVCVGVLEGTEVDVGIGTSVGVTSINFFFQDLPDPVLVLCKQNYSPGGLLVSE